MEPIWSGALVRISHSEGVWHYHAIKGRNLSVTDNVVDIIKKRLIELSNSTRQVLLTASCFGIDFSSSDLILTTGISELAIEAALMEAVLFEIVRQTEHDRYAFNNAQIHEVLYSSIKPDERAHLRKISG